MKDIPLFIILAILARFNVLLGPYWSNFSALGALIMFIGTYKSVKEGMLLSLMVIFISNLVVNFYYFEEIGVKFYLHNIALISFYLVALLKINTGYKIILSSLTFFIFSNFIVFLEGDLYPPTLIGLKACYILALPYLSNTFFSQLIFTHILSFLQSNKLVTN